MTEEKPNRKAMYRVFRSLWFTKEEVNFVALNEDVIIVKFGCLEDRSKILNLMPWLFDNCLFAMMLFIKGKDIETFEFNLYLSLLLVYSIPLEFMDYQTALDIGNAIGELVAIDWKDRNGGWTEFLRSKIKINVSNSLRRNCRGIGNPAIVRELKQLLVENDPEVIFLCETKVHANKLVSIRSNCRIEGCLAVNVMGKSGGLFMMWKEGKRFYGNVDPNKRQSSWDMLRKIGKSVKEKWIIEGDFNAILNNMEKDEGMRKQKMLIDDFQAIVDELLLVDLKTDKGWFTWTKVIRQSNSDHNVIFLDTEARKPIERTRDPRLNFRYDVCWAKENKAKNIIKNAWQNGVVDIIGKIENVGQDLGVWQYN
ncbi:hypothetical protein Goshw_025739 [Gossypium schwendimanii]|uniref:DUF4283 domain-containing protein n=1 Tax=Gossypium schwendimanii TaxID=34291 RepID=A0A7J9NAY0_GOSSC|nr:hypothetical protein [Gossypium schwendimanii]